MRPFPRRFPWLGIVLAVLVIANDPLTHANAQAPGQAQSEPARQVTLFAVVAVPGSKTIDPKLAAIQSQLRKLLPGHGFKLLDVGSKRLAAGESVRCDLDSGTTASAVLLQPLDENGKIELRCTLMFNEIVQFDTRVGTPPNQLFFCHQLLGNGKRLVIGVGAR